MFTAGTKVGKVFTAGAKAGEWFTAVAKAGLDTHSGVLDSEYVLNIVTGVLDTASGVVRDTGMLGTASGFFMDMGVLDTATEVLDMVIGKVTGGDSSIARKNNAPSSSDASSTVMALVLPGSGAELQVEAKWLGLSHFRQVFRNALQNFSLAC